jgi:hypothetical protein
MADVSVEFGAQDVGLEKALQQIQTEMGNLQGKVKSGELSMEELEQTMRRIGQVENMEKRLKAMGDASAESSPKIKKLGDDIDTAGSSAQSVGGIFDAEFKKIAGAFTVGNLAAQGFQKIVELAFSAAQSVVQGFSDALDLGGRLNELSSRTGESAGKLLVLETAFKNSGLEASTVGTAINKLQNFMQDAANGGDKQRAAMQSLGVSMSELAGKTPTEQMKIFADRIAGIEDPTARAAAASEVFGDKLGGKLLPLFSDFSTNLEDARAKVGSLEQVMDENAATFDAAAETIDAVKGKMAAFAAGVLGETIPALEDLGKSMEQVDSAGLGQDVGEFLSPRLEKLGYVVLGVVEDFKEFVSILQKLTGEGTALGKFIDRIIEFNTAMQNTINFVSPMDDLFNAFEQKGRAAADAQKELSSKTDTAAESIKSSGTAAQDATGKLDSLGTSAKATAQNIDGVFSLGSDFAPKLDGISGSWGGLNEQILGSKVSLGENLSLADSMTGSVQEQVQALGGVNESMESILASEKQSEESKKVSKDLASLIDTTYGKHAEKLAEIQAKQDALAAKETERKDKLSEALNFELAINEAKAAGDTELVKTLENQKLLNAEIQKAIDSGMGEKEAAAFAQQMVNAKNAAALVQVNTSTVSEAKAEASKAAEAAKSFATWLDYIKGVDPSAPVKSLKEQTADARKEITAFGEYIGKDLKSKSFPDIARELGIKNLGSTGTEQMNQILDFIKGKRAELTGIQPIDEKGGKTALDGIQTKLKDLGATPQTLNLDATKSIEGIKSKLKENIDLAVSTGEGSKILGEIKGFVETIKGLVEKIEPKLPVAALTA